MFFRVLARLPVGFLGPTCCYGPVSLTLTFSGGEPPSEAPPAGGVPSWVGSLGAAIVQATQVIAVPHGGAVASEGSEGGSSRCCQDREGVESAWTSVISICFEEALGIVCYKDIVNVFLHKEFMVAGLA